jgi:y4mF family transcriptional regulator
MHLEELSKIIRERRKLLAITQEDLAELAGISLRTLKAIETGKTNPTFDSVNKIADVLGLQINIEVKKPIL